MKDSWCAQIEHNGKSLSGGAARNVLISKSGGMDQILQRVAFEAATNELAAARMAVETPSVGMVIPQQTQYDERVLQ